jgi:KDO2-lipid IV(A) lauroyltransferase
LTKPFTKIIRERFEYLVAASLFGAFKAMGVDRASALAGGLARRVGPRLRVSNVARRNLARAFPDWSDKRIEQVVAGVWENLGRVAAEFPHLEEIRTSRVVVKGVEHLHSLRDDGRNGVFISGHFGNWEVNGAVALREGLPLHLIYREANNPWVEQLYRKGRSAASGGQIPKGASGARQALDVLKNGGHLGMLVDQKMNDGIEVPFFGRPAMTATACAQFALKFNCPLVPARTRRLNGAHFEVTLFPPMELPDSGDRHADMLELMTRINRLFEDWATDTPEQWLWLHKRWKE